ncbi:MAG: HEAT repeat domain-containing protein [Acidobacteria bacterium]|nr:HEAT repeat domain-containing protein [Acidobacteriota bacterium]
MSSGCRPTLSTLAVPALIEAVSGQADGYVRFRALVLLAGFNDPRARDLMLQALGDPNDRLRTVAYTYFEHHPDNTALARMLQALDREESEFVRPALTRALAAHGADPKTREALVKAIGRGQDLFRSAVIEALGDHRAQYAVLPLAEVAKLEGPLQDDAVLALGKIGDKRALETFAALQRSAPRTLQPSIAAAICLLGVNCSSHRGFLTETLRFAVSNPGYQELLRGAAGGLAALATAGDSEALGTLIEAGVPSRDPARAAIALAAGTVAIRNTLLLLGALEGRHDLDGAIELLREAFDMFEEDMAEERFFITVRRAYWHADEGSPARRIASVLVQKLEF